MEILVFVSFLAIVSYVSHYIRNTFFTHFFVNPTRKRIRKTTTLKERTLIYFIEQLINLQRFSTKFQVDFPSSFGQLVGCNIF